MDTSYWGAFPPNNAVSGTSELFSSSVAMLGDSYQPYQEAWCDQQKPVLPVNFTPFFDQPTEVLPLIPERPPLDYGAAVPHMDHTTIYGNYEAGAAFSVYHAEQLAQAQLVARHQAAQQVAPTATAVEEARRKEQYFGQKIVDSGIAGMSPAPMSTVTIPINSHHTPGGDSGIGMVTPSRRPSSVCGSDVPGRSPVTSSESGIENDGSPGGSEVTPSEEEGEGRVMCHACKGLYPSRRSLTGHIGRNEKCREIIDQVAAGTIPITTPADTNLRSGAMTNGQDGMSPICPHCDKFISHYKLQGNIRRHINTCGKTGNLRRSRPEKERKRRRRADVGPPAVLHEGFEPTPSFNPMLYNPPAPAYRHVMPREDHPVHPHQLHMQASMTIQLPTDPSPPQPPKREEPPDDAYICGLCDFVTIYKGNMKRHLNTCHKSSDGPENLKEWDRKLESMRASSLGMSREEMLQRLHLHRMNSTRGRKPGKRHFPQEVPVTHPIAAPVQQQAPVQAPIPAQALGYQQHDPMVLPMGMMPQEAEMFSMPHMQTMHYGYDMGGYIQ